MVLVTFAVLAILLASATAAVAKGDYKSGDVKKYGDTENGMEGKTIKGISLVMSKPGQAQMYTSGQIEGRSQVEAGYTPDKAHQFSITEMAIEGDDGKAAVFSFDKPLQGVYDMSDDMGYISTANFMSGTVRMGSVDNLALNTSDASAILKMEDVKTLYKGEDYTLMEFDEIYVITPDGQAKEFNLEKPVKMIYSDNRKLVVIDAYPTFTQSMTQAFQGKEQQSFGVEQMSMSSIQKKEEGAQEKMVSYEKPEIVRQPAKEITQKA